MIDKSVIPAVEINTPTGTVTLLNATVVSISPAATKGKIAHGTGTGWIDLFSWSFGANQSGSGGHVGGGSGAGKVSLHDIQVTKNTNLQSINFLFEQLLAGIHHHRH
jgi:type VI protein secretion system component Hcp